MPSLDGLCVRLNVNTKEYNLIRKAHLHSKMIFYVESQFTKYQISSLIKHIKILQS